MLAKVKSECVLPRNKKKDKSKVEGNKHEEQKDNKHD